ncbi:MAG TPA: hypothetical protein VF456_28320 [Vicinamibacterales bacterium]
MPAEGRNLLVVGHPGHELRAYGWIADARPRVCILTDGGGSANTSRLKESVSLLSGLGAQIGPICGTWTDRSLYEVILAGECASLVRSARQLADFIIGDRIDTVVSDAIEGYNPTHDVCEVLTSAAVALAALRGHRVHHLVFPLMGDPCVSPGFDRPLEAVHHLTEKRFDEKKRATLKYASIGGERLLQEIEDTLRRFGDDAFRCERWFAGASVSHPWAELFGGGRPFYEEYGERQVASGRYDFVLRFTEHVLPIFRHLCSLSTRPAVVTPHARAPH